MTRLQQAGIIAHQRLSEHLNKHDCIQERHIPSPWKNETLPTSFTLVVNGFGVKHVRKQTPMHLITVLTKKACHFCMLGRQKLLMVKPLMALQKGHVTLSMGKCAPKALQHFQQITPSQPTHSSAKLTPPNCGAKLQYDD